MPTFRHIAVTALLLAVGSLFACAGSGSQVVGRDLAPTGPPVFPVREAVASSPMPPTALLARLSPPEPGPAVESLPLEGWETAYALPYEPVHIMSGYHDRRGRRIHRGIDFAGQGPDLGLGTPIVSVGRARVTLIGRPEDNPGEYGRPLTRGRTVRRAGHELPVSAEVPGYGTVYFFTRNYGRWRSGAVVVTELLDGPLAGHVVRYMHMGAIRPDLEVGYVLERGEELGLMGGTAILDAAPHLHIDCEDSGGRRVDLTPYFGLDPNVEVEVPPEPDGPSC